MRVKYVFSLQKKESNIDSVSSMDEEISNNVAGFRSVFKATSIFGGVQVFNIVISLIRGKVLAILIGTAGMGLNGLLMSALDLVGKASGLGLSESAVRDISAANQTNDKERISRVYTIFKRWIWLTAILGMILTITLSPFLSKFAFGNKSQTISFILLSVTFIFGALTGGIYTFLRGIRKIKDLAIANIAGAIAGLLVALPIFYFLGIEGVVPAIIASAGTTFLVSLYFRRRVGIKTIPLSLSETFSGGKKMVALGITLTVSSLLTSAVTFILNSYISKVGDLQELGLYNAGHSIMSGYVGMVFAAMGADYYPRLSGVINNAKKWKSVVNQQAETVMLILGPLLSLILLSGPILIEILLSTEFLPSMDFIKWASIGILLRGINWVSGFILISKGDNKLFLYVQLASLIWSLTFNILFFNLLGISGLGISMILNYSIGAIVMFIVLKRKYNFRLSKASYKILFLFLFLLLLSVLFTSQFNLPWSYLFAGLTFILSVIISLSGMNKRMNLIGIWSIFLNRNK